MYWCRIASLGFQFIWDPEVWGYVFCMRLVEIFAYMEMYASVAWYITGVLIDMKHLFWSSLHPRFLACTHKSLSSFSFVSWHDNHHLFSYLSTCTWSDLILDLAEWHDKREEYRETNKQMASSADLSDRGMLFIIQCLAQSLHYIISVFWAVWVCRAGFGCGSSDSPWLQKDIWHADTHSLGRV